MPELSQTSSMCARSFSYTNQLSHSFNTMRGRNGEPFGSRPSTIPDRPPRRERKIMFDQVSEAALEAAAYVHCRDVVAAEFDALTHTGNRLRWAGKPKVVQFDFVTTLQRALKMSDVSLAAQRALQRKRLAAPKGLVHLFKQQSASPHRAGARLERRKSAGNFIGVQEAQTLHFCRKEFFGECCLPRAVTAGDEVDCWLSHKHVKLVGNEIGVNWLAAPAEEVAPRLADAIRLLAVDDS